jgi:hypothetical protein
MIEDVPDDREQGQKFRGENVRAILSRSRRARPGIAMRAAWIEGEPEEMFEANKQVVRSFVAALADRDWGRLADLLAEDLRWTLMSYELRGPGTMDRDGAVRLLSEALSVFSDDSRGWSWA